MTPTAGAGAPEMDPGMLNGRAVRLLVRSVWNASKLSAIALVSSVVINGLIPVATVLTAATVVGGLPQAIETGEGRTVERAHAAARWAVPPSAAHQVGPVMGGRARRRGDGARPARAGHGRLRRARDRRAPRRPRHPTQAR